VAIDKSSTETHCVRKRVMRAKQRWLLSASGVERQMRKQDKKRKSWPARRDSRTFRMCELGVQTTMLSLQM